MKRAANGKRLPLGVARAAAALLRACRSAIRIIEEEGLSPRAVAATEAVETGATRLVDLLVARPMQPELVMIARLMAAQITGVERVFRARYEMAQKENAACS